MARRCPGVGKTWHRKGACACVCTAPSPAPITGFGWAPAVSGQCVFMMPVELLHIGVVLAVLLGRQELGMALEVGVTRLRCVSAPLRHQHTHTHTARYPTVCCDLSLWHPAYAWCPCDPVRGQTYGGGGAATHRVFMWRRLPSLRVLHPPPPFAHTFCPHRICTNGVVC